MTYNNIKSLPVILKSRGVIALENRFANIPAITVGAGPSLDKNIELLKDVGQKVIIIASDSVLRKLFDMGIKPHFVCCIDFLEDNYKNKFEGIDIPSELSLVYNQTCHWKIPLVFDESRRFVVQIGSKISQWISKIFAGPMGSVDAGQTVTHMAFNLANYMGCNPICLIGQDLSFPDKVTDHAEGCSTWKTEGNELIEEKNIYGEQIYTILPFISMKYIFETKIRDTNKMIINATEGGLNIAGTQNMLLKDVILRYFKRNYDIYGIINGLDTQKVFDLRIQRVIQDIIKDFSDIEDDCIKICTFLIEHTIDKNIIQDLINTLRLKQDTINLLEDISTETMLYMMQQDIIDCDKIGDKNERVKKQHEKALKYYKDIGDNALFMYKTFAELLK